MWDEDKDGVFKCPEMVRLARCVGFDGSVEDFAEDYEQICISRGCKPDNGLSEAAIMAMLDDQSDDGCYLSTDELAKVLTDAGIDPSTPFDEKSENRPAALLRDQDDKEQSNREEKRPKFDRTALKNRLFLAWDQDGDGALKQAELKNLAISMGFAGTAEEWSAQYSEICKQYGTTEEAGLAKEKFMEVLDYESNDGCFMTDDELIKAIKSASEESHDAPMPQAPTEDAPAPTPESEATAAVDKPTTGSDAAAAPAEAAKPMASDPGAEVLKAAKEACAPKASDSKPSSGAPSWLDPAALKPPPKADVPMPQAPELSAEDKLKQEQGALRQSLKEKLFMLWDKDGDAMLKKEELLNLAKHLGFDGDDKAWGEEYAAMVTSRGCSPRFGLSQDAFMKFLDDESETGCFLTNEDLVKAIAAAEEVANQVPLLVLGTKTGVINKLEMMKVARLVGWIGTKLPQAGAPKKAGAVIKPPALAENQWCKELKQVCEDLVGGLGEGMTEEAAITLAEKAKSNLPAEWFEEPKAEEELEEAIPIAKAAAGAAAKQAEGKVGWRQKRQEAITKGTYVGPRVAKAPPTKLQLQAAADARLRKCDVCETEPKKPAVIKCTNCQAYFCEKCNEENHPTALLKKHVRTPLVQQGQDVYTRFKDLFVVGDQWELSTSVALWRAEFGWEKIGGLNPFTTWGQPNAFQILQLGAKRIKVRNSRGGGQVMGWLDIAMVVDKASGELMIRAVQ